ncbi:hypothetical protein [Nocardia sp. NPDC057440]|uniref:hypothetical protein n=1 Tax=Nocardia sp. NPDC057440 TaxID=3346134 RepID=UPI00366D4ADE
MKATIAYHLHRLGEYNKYLVAQVGAVGAATSALLGLRDVLPANVSAILVIASAQVAAVGVYLATNQERIDDLGDQLGNILER